VPWVGVAYPCPLRLRHGQAALAYGTLMNNPGSNSQIEYVSPSLPSLTGEGQQDFTTEDGPFLWNSRTTFRS